jgi:DNA-binding HxlR family transcriptional regulator
MDPNVISGMSGKLTSVSLCCLYRRLSKLYQITLGALSPKCEPDISTILSNGNGVCRRDICAVIKAVRKLGSEWRILLAYYLMDGPMRFNDLLRKGKPDDLNPRTLSRTLKYLQQMGIVEREVVGTEPFSVVYRLTEKGMDLNDVLSAYRRWGEKWTPSLVHPLPFPKAK